MISSLKQPASFGHGSYFLTSRTNLVTPACLPVLPSLRLPRISVVSLSKPLHIVAPIERKRKELSTSIGCSAYEAGRSEPVADARSESARKIKIGIYFATWWSLNVVFNIYNKKVLNAYPYPWLTSTLSLAAGSLIMLVSWALRIAEMPKTDLEFWKSLFPVAVAHTIGHVAATVSMSKVAVSFTHIIKSGEPAFSVLVSRFILGETFPPAVYLSLIPIIGGCGLSALTELNFNMIGFMGAMISNLAFVFRNIFSKKGMKGKSVSGMNYYACLSMLSLVILTPFAIAVEGPQMWAAGFQQALSDIGPQIIWWMAAQSVFYHLYNQVSYMSLDEISPLTFSIGNTMKRISVIVSSIIIFQTPVQPVNALGAAIAILGTFLYSQLLGLGNNRPLSSESALVVKKFHGCVDLRSFYSAGKEVKTGEA
ncbi:GABA/polyamine transporter, variant 2 [Salvia divinorum]|uniref:GABA/polyamine transporter, variant 2 n=1 Tax=Salvia divinorum TaxID=28513 RepID=A0ABD1I2H5_SALDI